MTIIQQIIVIGICVAGTMMTRFLPFLIFSEDRPTPQYIKYLGKALPAALFGMLVVYCLKDVNFISGSYGIPELIGIGCTGAIHLWKRRMILSIAVGTAIYMFLVQFIF